MTDVVAVGCGTLLVDLKDDAVVIHGLGGGSDDLGVFRGKAGPGGNEKGDVVVEFDVHFFKGAVVRGQGAGGSKKMNVERRMKG